MGFGVGINEEGGCMGVGEVINCSWLGLVKSIMEGDTGGGKMGGLRWWGVDWGLNI